MIYEEALEKIMSVPMFQKVGAAAYIPTLDGVNRLVKLLGHPEKSFKTIHVAGTNGKGSVSNMLSSVLMEAGYKVGCYTSPHLLDYRERVRINGEMVSENIVADFTTKVEPIIDEYSPSFFEITTALAFYAFALEEVDIAVIECGLGGLTDSTNIITPLLSVITNIGYDHTALLGDTISEIAVQKGGIIKPHTPVVIGERVEESASVFEDIASRKNAKLIFAEALYNVSQMDSDSGEISINNGDIKLTMGLRGACQSRNIVTLLASISELREQGFAISENALSCGVRNVCQNMEFLGRWQIVNNAPFTVCDTAHNRAGLEYVTTQLKGCSYKQLYIVMGFMADKDVREILHIMPKDAIYLFVKASNPRSMGEEELASLANEFGLKGELFGSVCDGYKRAISLAKSDDMIYVGGSTFVVADFLQSLR